MAMFNHRLPPVTSFTRQHGGMVASSSASSSSSSSSSSTTTTTAAHSPGPPPPPPPHPQGMTFKKEPLGGFPLTTTPPSSSSASSQRSPWGFFHSLVNIKQEKPSEQEEEDHHHHHHHHYGGLFGIAGEERHPTLGGPGGGGGGGGGMAEAGSVIQDLSLFHHLHHHPHHRGGDLLLGLRSGAEACPEEPKTDPQARKAKRPKSETQGTKAKRKPGAVSSRPLVAAAGDGDAAMLAAAAANQKPHVCEHCSAAFRSSYHLRRHVLIHTGERPYQCGQCNMGFIQKYLLQRHEKIHSREKPFGCDQCSMKFIQKYHMERHKRTHSGEKPYKCETCQQYFSRTDRLLKHRRTCGEAIGKAGAGMDPGPSNHSMGNLPMLPQGNTGSSRRKSKAKCMSAENKEHKPSHKVSDAQMASNMTLQNYAVEFPIVSSSGGLIGPGIEELQKKVPKLVFKKGNRKGTDKSFLNFVSPVPDLLGQKPSSGKPGGSLGIVANTGVDAIGLLQAASGKPGHLSSNYDDAMQFSKKRRYLQTASSNSAFSINVGHMASQPSVIQSAGVSVMDSETPLSLIDSSSLNADIKSCHDKSGIPDEVLQSLLEQYSHKSEGQKEDPFSITEQRVDLHASGEHSEMVQEDNLSPSPQTSSNDKTSMLQEYSKYLQHAFERTTNSAGFAFGPSFQFVSLSSSLHNHSLFQDKQIYTTSPLECGFSQSVTSVLPSALSKPPFGMLLGSQPGFYLSALEATHQQLTPSQELDDLIDSQKNVDASSGYQSAPQKLNSQKEQKSLESSTSFPIPSQELANQIDPQKDLEHRATYQIETFAQAFGSQFKTGSRVPMTFIANSNGEVDHRVRTSVSDFSGYTNIMSDVSEPCSTRVKTPTSQSYR
ncbi:zinc finger protein 281 isoform X2 [Sceloporus undulatus]|uniref:zinc finger protein 281 isoform X1 n=1 Tax=Sceloporus undulatus TaxID=8520 RepID=UPI001C4A83B0|nr:zinc finger protein 281 isoform X1 [Sceloporus undulatus]XP_042321212.1 zinc finger protein 281 isoform X2 [Sceloporus undulatus]